MQGCKLGQAAIQVNSHSEAKRPTSTSSKTMDNFKFTTQKFLVKSSSSILISFNFCFWLTFWFYLKKKYVYIFFNLIWARYFYGCLTNWILNSKIKEVDSYISFHQNYQETAVKYKILKFFKITENKQKPPILYFFRISTFFQKLRKSTEIEAKKSELHQNEINWMGKRSVTNNNN